MSRPKAKGIYCIEGDWWGKPGRQSSVEPMLELLSKWDHCPVPYIRRDVATRAEFDYYLKQCAQQRFSRYAILYFALHGTVGTVKVGDNRLSDSRIDVQVVADALEGKCKRRLLHFGSCSTLAIHGNELRSILKRTGALCVSGFKRNVDWLESSAFEILLFGEINDHTLTVQGLRSVERRMRKVAGTLARHLGFEMVVR